MREYSPKRRTAVVFVGCGTAGAYHAGVLKALDESGVKLDLLVGSGAGTLAAAFGAVSGGGRLYGKGGFWDGASWRALYRLRPALRLLLGLLAFAVAVFLLPLIVALVAGLLFPFALVADLAAPGLLGRWLSTVWAAPALLRIPYLAALATPGFVLSVLAVAWGLRLLLRQRRRAPESFEFLLDPRAARARLRRALWDVARGAISGSAPGSVELGRRFVGLAAENLGQPGFRELILRTADVETGRSLSFLLLDEAHRAAFAGARGRGRSQGDPRADAVDLRVPGYESLLFDALVTGLLPPVAAPVERVAFPRGGVHAGETHRLADATLAGGCGISEALRAGASQVIVVSAVPERAGVPSRRRGPRALADGLLSMLERRAVAEELGSAERINRMVETLGHETPEGGRAWEDPATGRRYRDFALWVIRPERRGPGPLELDGARDPATEAVEGIDDLVGRGYRDAYRGFLEPVVGAVAEPRRQGDSPESTARLVKL